MLTTATPVVAVAVALAAVLVALAYRRRAATLRLRLRQASRDLEHLQTAFSRFAPAPVVDEIAATGRSTAARKQEVTVMFADLQGFTALTDQLDPSLLVRILNGYFLAMSAVITDHRGSVSKFMGDGLMALFGMLEHNPWQARDAVVSALAMREALERYNATLRSEGLPALRFGVGIHRGEGVVGVVGSDSLMDFTAIGDVVNVASRVEALTRRHGVDILLTEEVRSALGEGFELREMPAAPVKGKAEPIVTFALVDAAKDTDPAPIRRTARVRSRDHDTNKGGDIEEIIRMVSEKTGLSADLSKLAVETVVSYLKTELPAPIAEHVDAVIAGKAPDLGGAGDLVKGLGGLLGK